MGPKQWFVIVVDALGTKVISRLFDKYEEAMDYYKNTERDGLSSMYICETVYGC